MEKIGKVDLLIHWKRPAWYKKAPLPKEEWNKLPEILQLRQIKVQVEIPGFRTKSFYISTTLLDPAKYPAKDLADLYFRRWSVELFFRDQKTTMKMEILRCKTPAMIRKELLMYFITYNAIRHLIYESALDHGTDPMRISFKGALQALRQAEFHFESEAYSPKKIRQIRENLLSAISKKSPRIDREEVNPDALSEDPSPTNF